ncbi:carbohydrate-binding module family 18 protein [Cucurbitaria berberidis CBS 394.84]|uniref:Carbohydrate-binding module family 18 protein n=1 Tax=Cucurbitaria berberidis CBS 394.84 TaxID=1168544 RepID=A0A9P4L4W1_9PLEO|nr:carbohydrate-binding module family 18 protein [Cucurbitaria berberidis CBS 394.84]KAF1841940.1 carbohydrate-binding module family 18 protein [Cucurbitaria berberidis CBS 394.84]
MNPILLLIVGLLKYATVAAAANTIRFINHCPYDIWYWTVGPAGSRLDGLDKSRIKIPGNHGSVTHGMVNTELLQGGITLKIRDYPKYRVAPAGIVQVEYHFEPTRNAIWYDLSVIDCDPHLGPNHPSFCPLIGGGVEIYIPGAKKGSCPPAWCSNGRCENTYDRTGSWLGEPTFKCKIGVDILVETCTERVGYRTFQDKPTPYHHVSAPESVPHDSPKVSPDGICGGMTGYTCTGSGFGDCCSAYGYCGMKPAYCNAGCQSTFGVCLG